MAIPAPLGAAVFLQGLSNLLCVLQAPITLVEPEVERITRGCEEVEIAIRVEIAHRQAMALRIAQALPGVAEADLPVIPPDGGLLFSGHQGIGIAIRVQVGEEDGLKRTAAQALPRCREQAGLPTLRPALIGPDGCPGGGGDQRIQVAIAVQVAQGDGAAAGCAG